MSTEPSKSRLPDLAAQLKRATAPVTADETAVRHRSRTVTVAQSDDKKFEKIQENPFYQIALSKEQGMRLPNQKREAMVALLSYDKTKSAEENEKLTKAYMQFLDYMEEQSLQSSKSNIAGQNAKVFAELKQVIDEFSRGLMDFKTEIGPFTRRLEAIYNVRLSGKAIELLEEIIEDRKAIAEGKELLVTQQASLDQHTDRLESLTGEITSQQAAIAALGEEFRFGVRAFGLKGSARREIASRQVQLDSTAASAAEATADIEKLQSDIAKTQELIGSTRDTKFGELAADKAELQEMLDVSNEDHVAAHERLKDKTLAFINTAETRIDAVLGNVEEVNKLTAGTAKRNGAMVIVSAIMNEAVKEALGKNQTTLGEFEPPADPASEDEITKAEREETRTSLLRHIKTVTLADSHTTQLRNSLTRNKDQLESMLTANEERIRSTKHLRTSGISTMAAEMAVTMTALADAANAEALHMSQTMVDGMSKTVMDIRSKEVMRHASEMGIRNQQLAELIVATQQTDRIARVGIEESRKSLTELNRNLTAMSNVTADLQDTLKAGEAVYAEAQRDATALDEEHGPRVASNDDTRPAARKTGTGGPAPDPFG